MRVPYFMNIRKDDPPSLPLELGNSSIFILILAIP